MEPAIEKNFKLPIILIKLLDNDNLLVVDSKTTIRFLESKKFGVVAGFKGNISHMRYKTKVVAFSSDASYFGALSSDARAARLYNVKSKKTIAKIDRHQGEISCIGIDPKNRYMFSCGDDGKTFAIDIKTGKIVFTLPIHKDTINDVAFSSNGQWVATASYDRRISVFNIATLTPKHMLKAHSAPVMKLQFLSQHRLLSIDKNSKAIIWDIYTGSVLARLEGIHDNVTQIALDSEERFLFLATELGYVLVYELQNYTLLSAKYIKLKSCITALCFCVTNQNLVIGTESGELLFYDLFEDEVELKKLLQAQKYDLIQEYVDKNPLLQYTKVYKLVSKLWEQTLERAKLSLQKNDKQTAKELFDKFKNIPAKNTIMKKIIKEYSEFDRFATAIKQGKISLAYGIANAYPSYKESKLFKTLEAHWKKVFVAAQKYALEPRSMEKARELLLPYRGISEKTPLIQELFTQGDLYKRFKVAIGQKDFKIAFELVKQHPFLKEFPEYDALLKFGDSLYIKSQKFMQEGDTHSAVKILRTLVDFTEFSQEAKELLYDVESYQKFFNAIEDEDMQLAYNLLDSLDNLMDTEDGQKLQDQWNKDFNKAKLFAAKGDVIGVKKALENYMNISSKNISLAFIFGLCYIVQLENALYDKKDQRVLENGIKNYILYFGIDERIENFFDMFKKHYAQTKLNLELQTKGSASMWKPAMIVNSILE